MDTPTPHTTKQPTPTIKPKNKLKVWFYWLLVTAFILVCIAVGVTIFLVSSDKGTAKFLALLQDQTEMQFEHSEGNLLNGLTLKNLVIPLENKAKKKQGRYQSNLHIDKAELKIGWKSVLADDVVHLRKLKANNVRIIDNNMPTGKPFSYKPLSLPTNLHVDNIDVAHFSFEKITRKPSIIKNIKVDRLDWVADKITLKNGALVMRKIANVSNINGSIAFNNTYPINATAKVEIPLASRIDFDVFDVTATGSLKNIIADVSGKWHGKHITAKVTTQPVIRRLPFQATVPLAKFQLPYLLLENVKVEQGAVAINGTLDKMFVAFDGELASKHLPKGHYHTVGFMPFKENIHLPNHPPANTASKNFGITLAHLNYLQLLTLDANTSEGTLHSKNALLSWKNDFFFTMSANSEAVAFLNYIPSAFHDYLPKTIDGDLNFAYKSPLTKKDSAGNPINTKKPPAKLAFTLNHRRGDQYNLALSIPAKASNPSNNKSRQITTVAHINNQSINTFAKGDYHTNIVSFSTGKPSHKQHSIHLHDLTYKGEAGDLSGSANIIVQKSQPLQWRAKVTTDKFLPQYFKPLAGLPVLAVAGKASAKGTFTDKQQSYQAQQLDADIQLTNTNDATIRKISLLGSGDATLKLQNTKLSHFDVTYDGQMSTQGIPNGMNTIHVSGLTDDLTIHKLIHKGDAGQVNITGKLNRQQGLAWQFKGRVDNLNPAFLKPDIHGSLSGNINTSGIWQQQRKKVTFKQLDVTGNLKNQPFKVQGNVDADLDLSQTINSLASAQQAVKKLNAHNLSIQWKDNKFVANGNKNNLNASINISTLAQLHPKLDGTVNGLVNISNNGYKWDITGTLNRFNPNVFTEKLNAVISGSYASKGAWQHGKKQIQVSNLDLSGSYQLSANQSEPFRLKGSVAADIKPQFSFAQPITDIASAQHVLKRLSVNNLNLLWRSNEITMNGTKQQLSAQVNAQQLSQLHPKVTGTAKGLVNLTTAGVNWNIAGTLAKFNPKHFTKKMDAVISGSYNSKGVWQPQHKSVTFDKLKLSGLYQLNQHKQEPFTLTGGTVQADLVPNFLKQPITDFTSALQAVSRLTIDDIALTIRENKVKLNGNKAKVTATVNAPRLKALHPKLFGGTFGKVVVTPSQVSWQLTNNFKKLNPLSIAKSLPTELYGAISGSIDSTGVWSPAKKQVTLENIAITGNLNKQKVSINGDFALKPANHLTISQLPQLTSLTALNAAITEFNTKKLIAHWGENNFHATGNQQKIDVNVLAQKLNHLSPKLKGNVTGDISLINFNDISPNLTLKGVAAANMVINAGRITGNIVDFGKKESKLNLFLSGVAQVPATTKPSIEGTKSKVSIAKRLETLNLNAVGSLANHQLTVTAKHSQLGMFATLSGGFKQGFSHWSGQLSEGKLTTNKVSLHQNKTVNVDINTLTNSYKIDAHCWQPNNALASTQQKASLCFTDDVLLTSAKGTLGVHLRNFDSAIIKPFLPESLLWNGTLQGKSSIKWQQGKSPTINATFYTDDGTMGVLAENPDDQDALFQYKRLVLKIKSVKEGLNVRFDAKTKNAKTGYLDIVIDPNSKDKTINGALVFDDVHLSVFKPFLPGIRNIKGTASLAGGMSGPLKSPQFFGNLSVKNASFSTLALPLTINNIQLLSKIRGKTAAIAGSFNSGDGLGKLNGEVHWQKALLAKLQLTGKKLLVKKPPTLTAEVSPNINLSISPKAKKVTITGDVLVDKGTVTPLFEETNVISASEDVVVIDNRGKKSATSLPNKFVTQLDKQLQKELTNNVPAVLRQVKLWKINADIRIDLADDIYFRGFGATIPLGGNIKIAQRNKQALQAKGSIAIKKRVPVELYGQNLDLTRGNIIFKGALTEPTLDIATEKKISGDIIGVNVSGTPKQPVITVVNDAGLTEQQALNALVTGRIDTANPTTSLSGFQSSVNNSLAAAGLSLGLKQTRKLTNTIGRGFGLSGLTVDAAGTNDDAKVNITGYITPDLYLRYGVGVFTPVDELTFRYQVSRRFYIEASSALEKAIDLFYNWRY